MILPWVPCSDILIEILSYVDPLKAASKMMRLNLAYYRQLKRDKHFWYALTSLMSCPVCILEFCKMEVKWSVDGGEFWYHACRMAVAARSIRSQWSVVFSARTFEDTRQKGITYVSCLSGTDQNSNKGDKPPLGVVKINSPMTQLSYYFMDKLKFLESFSSEGRIAACIATKSKTIDDATYSKLRVIPFEEMKVILNRFLCLESGVLFTDTSFSLHQHELRQTVQCLKRHKIKPHIGSAKSLATIRNKEWEEVSATPMNNPRNLRVLAPFLGKDSGAKRDMRSLTRSMYNAVGGGCVTTAPVRWFWTKVCTETSTQRRGEVLIAVCFNHSTDLFNPSELVYNPNSVRVVGIARRRGFSLSWVHNVNSVLPMSSRIETAEADSYWAEWARPQRRR